MAMKRLIIDMDDVIADTTGQFISYYEREYGVRVERETLHHKEEGEGFPNKEAIMRYLFEPGFFRKITPYENSINVLEKLNQKYDLFIVSAAMQFPQSLSEKQEWLQEHCPFLHWKQIVFCGSKAVVHGDYMIDDMIYNLETFNGEKFIYTAPHNMQYNHYQRLNDWNEVAKQFL
jgi:5'(3')-deoxyribonucleotidase